jgi:putative chitinase
MPHRTPSNWYEVLVSCNVKPTVAAVWSQVFADTIKPGTFSADDLDLRNFLGQILHESVELTHLEENLNYTSAERICAVWPTRFATLTDAQPCVNNPQVLANRVYGGRMGNTDPGDGWRYHGRSPLQITGKSNYAFVGGLMGQDLIGLPELLGQPHYALEASIAWWEKCVPDAMLGDPLKVSQRVNGALIGLADREQLTQLAERALV